MPSIAVIIVTWNSAHFMNAVLEAVISQSLQPKSILVIDNGSQDVDLLVTICQNFPNCELLLLGENRGFAAANNVGIKHCNNVEYIALLNPDAFPEVDWLAELVKAAQKHPETAAFGSRLLDYANPNRLDGAGDFLTIAGKPGRRGHGGKAENQFLNDEVIFSPCAAAALYRYSALKALGGFDERFFCYVEDIDLAFRLLLTGNGSRYVAKSVVRHIGSALTGRRSDFSVYYGQRNLTLNYVKNMPSLLFWVFLIPHLILNVAYLIGASLAGRGNAVWRAKRDAIKMLPEFWLARKVIQSERKIDAWKVLKILKLSLW